MINNLTLEFSFEGVIRLWVITIWEYSDQIRRQSTRIDHFTTYNIVDLGWKTYIGQKTVRNGIQGSFAFDWKWQA